MIRVIFKNLEKSELAKGLARDRIATVVERFPDLQEHRIDATLSMHNSPQQAGPDVFTAKFYITGNRYRSVVIEKSASNLYAALADVVEHTLERLNRYGDKKRVKKRNQARKQSKVATELTNEEMGGLNVTQSE